MKKWSELEIGNLIYRLKMSRYGDKIIEFTIHEFIATFDHGNFCAITYFDDIQEHHAAVWDIEHDEKFLSINVNKDVYSSSSFFEFDVIEYYCDNISLSNRLTYLKKLKNKEIDFIDKIFTQLKKKII